MLVSNCVVCGIKKFSSIKYQDVYWTIVLIKFEIIKIVNKFLVAGDEFMPKLYSRKPGFI